MCSGSDASYTLSKEDGISGIPVSHDELESTEHLALALYVSCCIGAIGRDIYC